MVTVVIRNSCGEAEQEPSLAYLLDMKFIAYHYDIHRGI